MGADLTYECLGGNTYRVTLSFYRDCIGIPAPANPLVYVRSASCGQNLNVTVSPRPGTGQEVTPSCSSSVTTCSGGTFTGIQEWVYDGIITLPMNCTDWVFSYSLCCRNAAITTITNPGTSTFYIYSTLNNVVSTCNSSPTFSNKPVPFLCLGQQYCFNHGAYDPDGDSLVYELITPKQTAGADVVYMAPYNASNPLNSFPATSFNPVTGDICLNPQNIEVTVMAVLVKEYRNGVLIGSVERDLQLTVMNCANNLPSLTGINGTNDFSITVCANAETCFDIFSIDPDAGQTLEVNWDNGIAGASFSSSGGTRPTGTFCWTPQPSDIGSTNIFTVRVNDDACPYYGSQIYSYTVNVIGITANAGPDQLIACSDLATLTAVGSGGSGSYTYQWSNGSTSQWITVGEGTYWVTISDGTCMATDTVNVMMPYIPVAAFTHSTTTCNNLPVSFTDQSTTPGGIIWSWYWDFGDGTSSTLQNPTHLFPGAGTYDVSLIIENTLGCLDTIIQQITIADPPTADFSYSNTCVGTSVTFTDQSSPSASVSGWNWNFGDGTSSTLQNPGHTYTTTGTYTVTLITNNAFGCSDTAVRIITVNPLPVISAGADQSVCAGSSITLTASGGTSYTWMPGGSTSPTIVVNPSGSTPYVVTGEDANGCINSDTVWVSIDPLPVVTAGADVSICAGTSTTLSAGGAATYTWTPGGSTSGSIIVSPSSGTNYTVTGTDLNGCSASDIVSVNVNSIPLASAGPDQHICSGSSAVLNASGGGTYSWSPGGSTSSSITVNPSSSTTYVVTVSNGSGCSAQDSMRVFVHPPPSVSLQSLFLCTGSTTTLDAGPGMSSYLWTPNGETTQTLVVTTGGNYGVTVTDSLGCSSTASASVTMGTAIAINLDDVFFCQGDSAILDVGYSGLTYNWSTGQTTQAITIYNQGSYSVTVNDTSGCSGSITINAQTNPIPVANFTTNSVCAGTVTSFTDASSVGSGIINAWSWDFGDGATSTDQNPDHTYTSPGTYTVTLMISSAEGCVNQVSNDVTVNPLPVASFTAGNTCQGQVLNFTNTSTVSSGIISTYSWNFGDSNNSSLQNPSHTYSVSGSYSVSLQVSTAGGCSNSVSQTVNIRPLPVASFSTMPVCLGSPSTFLNTSGISTGSITSYTWDFGNTATSTQTNPAHTYASAGTYTVRLIAVSSFGCSDTVINSTQINSLPLAMAGSDQTICSGSTANLTASGGVSYTWMPGSLNSANITVNPVTGTNYTVSVTDVNGCSANDVVRVNVNSLPSVSAGPDRVLCTGSSVTLNAAGGATYTWTPGLSTGSSITVNPTVNTTYTVTGTDLNGCTNSDLVTVSVNPLPLVNAGPDRTICMGSTTSLSASGANTYLWNPGGSTSSGILVGPAASTNYIVTGTDVSGCINRDTVRVNVNPLPVVNLSPAFICPGFSTTLDAGNPGSTFFWSTGETSQTISVNDSGTYTVEVTGANGCPVTASTVVTLGNTINSVPVISSVCSGMNATLNAGNPGSSYLWSTGSTDSSISVATAGNYSVTITDPNGCTGTVLHTVNLNPLPVASFSATPVCEGDIVLFTNTSSVSSGTIQAYSWDMGDGFTSFQTQPSHNYSNAGTYNVSLVVVSDYGCNDSITGTVEVYPLPVASFSSSTVCEGQGTALNDATTIASGSINSWNWSFGDGTSGSGASISHTYAQHGSYSTTLIVSSDHSCRDTVQQNVTVHQLPEAIFSAPDACVNSPVQLTNNSSAGTGSILLYTWDLGDGNTSNSSAPVYQYTVEGSYTISLHITSSVGCTHSLTDVITVHPEPVSAFTSPASCESSSTRFTNTSSIVSGSISNYYWDFGDNSSSNDIEPSHSYAGSGNYTVRLITTSAFGCRDTVQQTTIVHPDPVAAYTAMNVCEGAPVEFLESSAISSGIITSWSWDFGDGTGSSLDEPVHIYNNSGSYPVSLIVTSAEGCTDELISNVVIYPNPVAAFLSSNVCLGNNSTFINQSGVAGGISYSSHWDFSDGNQSSQTNPTHTFSGSGIYTVQLNITTVHGCVNSTTQNARIYLPPVTLFSADDVCRGGITSFNDNSYSQDGNIVRWYWNFGDGSASTEGNPAHLYTQSGKYGVSLTTTTSFGCSSPYQDTVEIYERPVAGIQTANVCEGMPVQFINTSVNNTGTSVSYLWDLGNGFTSADSSITYLFPQPGTYDITLTSTSDAGCSDTQLHRLSVYPNPEVLFAANEACENANLAFLNQSGIQTGSIQSYQWDFGDGSSGSNRNPIHNYSTAGTYQVSLTAVSDQGCVNNRIAQVIIHPQPHVQFSGSYQGCAPLNANFLNTSVISSGNISGWLWNFGDGNISTEEHPVHTYTLGGSWNISLTVVSDQGCQATYTAPASVRTYPQPDADFTANPLVSDNVSPTVHFTNLSSGFTSYIWNFGDGTSTSHELNPVHTFSDTGTYTARLITINSYGCRDTMLRHIEIRPKSTLFAPNCFTPNGDGHNDKFRPYYTNMTDIQVWIFDRWGLLLTSWDGLEGNWDGYYGGEKCQQDTYVYKIRGLGVDGKYSEWVGHVSIVY